MIRVMAQGTFDVLHPGHLHYLKESAALGDELVVIIGRDEKMKARKDLLFDHDTRRDMVSELEVVDEARVGSRGDIYDILEVVEPDIVTLGFDQELDEDRILAEYDRRGYDIELRRMSAYEPTDGEIVSSSKIKERLKQRCGEDVFFHLKD